MFSAVAMMNQAQAQAQANVAMLRAQQHPAAMAAAASMAVALGQFPGGHHGHHMAMLHGGNMLRPPPMGLPPGKCDLHIIQHRVWNTELLLSRSHCLPGFQTVIRLFNSSI